MANGDTLGILVDAKTTEAIDYPIIENVNGTYRSMATCAAKTRLLFLLPAMKQIHKVWSPMSVITQASNSPLMQTTLKVLFVQ